MFNILLLTLNTGDCETIIEVCLPGMLWDSWPREAGICRPQNIESLESRNPRCPLTSFKVCLLYFKQNIEKHIHSIFLFLALKNV